MIWMLLPFAARGYEQQLFFKKQLLNLPYALCSLLSALRLSLRLSLIIRHRRMEC